EAAGATGSASAFFEVAIDPHAASSQPHLAASRCILMTNAKRLKPSSTWPKIEDCISRPLSPRRPPVHPEGGVAEARIARDGTARKLCWLGSLPPCEDYAAAIGPGG